MDIKPIDNSATKPSKMLPGYDVSRDGKIMLGRKILTATWVARRGYYVYPVDVDGKRSPKLVATLVADAWIAGPDTDDRCYVKYLDTDLKNCHADNLIWETASERRFQRGLRRLLEDCPLLTSEQFGDLCLLEGTLRDHIAREEAAR